MFAQLLQLSGTEMLVFVQPILLVQIVQLVKPQDNGLIITVFAQLQQLSGTVMLVYVQPILLVQIVKHAQPQEV